MSEFVKTPKNSNIDSPANSDWDMSNVEFTGSGTTDNPALTLSAADNVIEAQSPEIEVNPLEDLEFWSNEYRQAELQFAKFRQSAETQPSTDPQAYYRKLLNYEDDQAYNWQRLTEATNEARSQGEAQDDYTLANLQRLSSIEPSETIEAASGVFFSERMSNLRRKIRASTNSDQATKDLDFANDTWQRVYEYITAAIDYDLMRDSYHQYQLTRRSRHNDMIKQLNGLNDLAETYDSPRFTLRNFMTNEFYYRQDLDKGGWLNQRANYDRETVLAYFKTVYQNQIRGFERSAREIDLFPSRS